MSGVNPMPTTPRPSTPPPQTSGSWMRRYIRDHSNRPPVLDRAQFPVSLTGQVVRAKSAWERDRDEAMEELDRLFPGVHQDKTDWRPF